MKKIHLWIALVTISSTVAAQNVGIGTSTPVAKLEVAGDFRITTPFYGLWHTDGTTSVGTYVDGDAGWLGTFSDHPIWFFTNNGALPQMVVDNTGNVGIGTTMPSEKLDVSGKTKTTDFQMTNGAMNGYVLKTDASGNASWVAPSSGGLIPFSTGIILSGATVVSAAPVLMGFGSHAVEVIDGSGESTMPPEAGGFAFTVPFSGTIQNLQISADLLVSSVVAINTLGLEYDFTVFLSPSAPNDGTDHLSSPYITTALTSSVRFGFPNTVAVAGTFRSATNINTGSLAVTAGDRIGIRVRTDAATDPSAADITQLSFSASLFYTY